MSVIPARAGIHCVVSTLLLQPGVIYPIMYDRAG